MTAQAPDAVLEGLPAAWSARLRDLRPRVLLTDGDDPRAHAAAAILATRTPVRPVLLTATPHDRADGVETTEPAQLLASPDVEEALTRRPDGTPRAAGRSTELRDDPLAVGVAALRAGHVSACVAGATRPSGDVIRAGLSVLGTAPGVRTVSSCFVLVLSDGRKLAYGDCAVLPTPDADQLADIATSTAGTFAQLTGEEPAVAMLSFSTLGSAQHPDAEMVREATLLARRRRPDLSIDGELQFDAAALESVARTKAQGSPVAGHANVFVFPNLAAGNIGYKITERLAGARAYGPVLQGLSRPLNDLSRGCSADDIVAVALLSAVQGLDHASN